jgi:hypothetical protein
MTPMEGLWAGVQRRIGGHGNRDQGPVGEDG